MPTQSDGKNVCDFAGLGSAVAAFNGARVDLENCDITTEGVAKCMVYVDNASDVVIKNCRLEAKGGTLYDGYINSADFNFMVATPWVLGMTGNARGTNIMGDKTSMAVVDSDVKARNWGVLSTDNGEVLYEGEGTGSISRLTSDAFGIMTHGWAGLTITDGTEMDTENAALLLRSGGVKIRVEDGAKVRPSEA